MSQLVTNSKVTEQALSDYLKFTGVSLSPKESRMFFDIAMLHNLHPLKKEVFVVKYGGTFNIITGYNVYIQRAESTGQLDGWRAWTEGSNPDLKACIEIKRKDWVSPYYHEVYLEEYDQKNKMWLSKPKTMLKKVAIAQGFRLAFPLELSGVPYTQDELPEPEKDITPQADEKKSDLIINKLYAKIKSQGLNDEEVVKFAKFANFKRDDIDSCWNALNRFSQLFKDYQNSQNAKVIDHESI